jgi:Fur family transcriptional regulator, ferric uptake regulator
LDPVADAAWIAHAEDELRRSGHRGAGARTAVVSLLGSQECCLSAQEIFDRLRGSGRRVGIATVYRVLDLLTGLQLVQRVDVGDGIARFEPAHPDGEHHHHLVCGHCGRVVAFEDPALERALAGLSTRLGHDVAAHDVVLRGECADCLAATP